MRIEHDPQRLHRLGAGQANRQQGIVVERRAGADHDRFVHRAHHLHAQVRRLPGDGEARIVLAARRKAVGRARQFQRHHRPALRDAQEVAEMIAPRLGRADSDDDLDARLAQQAMAAAGDPLVGVLHRADDAGDARRDDRLGAGRRAALVKTRLQRHVQRRPGGRIPGLVDRMAFGVRAPAP